MPRKSNFILLVASVLATSAWAQSAPQPLNLTLPRDSVSSQTDATTAPARSAKATSTAAVPAPAAATVQPSSANSAPPDTHYDATANQIVDAADSANRPVDVADSGKPACDDATYAQPQVHGSVGMGVVAGNHVSGNYQTGSVRLSKNLGSCDHPTGGLGLSINVGQGNFNGRRGWH
ncbi:hypothetical protein [Rudaea cellulosilytica]|uniref:hypothetical protein n=1 Tax=Rudaea cellulosilytica TaxID=540746 RepID=UPI00037B03B6|nr:hypothetical protein [Rudaea cellulosilytica]